MKLSRILLLSGLASASPSLQSCPGYRASNVQTTDSGLTAELSLAGEPCNVYGQDIEHLILEVTYETDDRLHVKIQDAANQVYQVPESVFPRASSTPPSSSPATSKLIFAHTDFPFSFNITRRGAETPNSNPDPDPESVIFDTSVASLVFQTQYLRLRTALPPDPYLYGLGEHSDPFRLNTTNYTRTLWNRDSFGVPTGSNLYGAHPIYLEQRARGAHAVLLLNSNGMDVVLDRDPATNLHYLEYNTLGGVVDLYFFAGPSPIHAVRQYGALAGRPAMPPYWGLGFHNCRWGYRDAFELAEVAANYTAAAIPLETLWTDIDYMDRRRVFSLDPDRFPLSRMRALVRHLHRNHQRYVVMVDPAVAYQDYPPLRRGLEQRAFLLRPNGSTWLGVVWPGVVAFPDWFASSVDDYWTNEFRLFFDKDAGLDIDALWIDMNEPSNFPCGPGCDDPYGGAKGFPPPSPPVRRKPPREIPGWPCDFQPSGCTSNNSSSHNDTDNANIMIRQPDNLNGNPPSSPSHVNPDSLAQAAAAATGDRKGLPNRNLLYPKYSIHNKAAFQDDWNSDKGGLSNRTINTDVMHQNGLAMYDTHNLYGSLMSTASRGAMLARRPGLRPLIITRSTFAGAGSRVGHWLGDNLSTWAQYRASVRGILAFTAIFQFNMVGADVCGFAGATTEELCARWAALGAFYPFFRNHNTLDAPPQEFYRWASVARAARRAIRIRYRLLDYLYTALRRASRDGTPALSPVFYHYPTDRPAWALELQFFFGPAIMVCPVTEPGAPTSVDVYLPDDTYYDWYTHEPLRGRGRTHTFVDVDLATIPLLIRAGVIVPLRDHVASVSTTTELRRHAFELLIPLDHHCRAAGELYLDDGLSLEQRPGAVTDLTFTYTHGLLSINGTFATAAVEAIPHLNKVTILGDDHHHCSSSSSSSSTRQTGYNKRAARHHHHHGKHSRSVEVNISLKKPSTTQV